MVFFSLYSLLLAYIYVSRMTDYYIDQFNNEMDKKRMHVKSYRIWSIFSSVMRFSLRQKWTNSCWLCVSLMKIISSIRENSWIQWHQIEIWCACKVWQTHRWSMHITLKSESIIASKISLQLQHFKLFVYLIFISYLFLRVDPKVHHDKIECNALHCIALHITQTYTHRERIVSHWRVSKEKTNHWNECSTY